MPGRGVFFALEAADEQRLLTTAEPRRRAALIANTVEERWDETWLYQVGELWYSVHFCLHGGTGYPAEGSPAEARAIFGGVPLGVPGVYSIDYKDGELTRQIASACGRIKDDAVWARAGLVERKDYAGPRTPDLQMAVVEAFHDMSEFYRRAADAGRAVIFTVDR